MLNNHSKNEYRILKSTSLGCELRLIKLQEGFDGATCWTHARAAINQYNGTAVMTMQKLRLSGSDIFYALHSLHSDDYGETWSEPLAQTVFTPVYEKNGSYIYIVDYAPFFHKATKTLCGVGFMGFYNDDEIDCDTHARDIPYSIYNEKTRQWDSWKQMQTPDDFFHSGAGSVQILEKPDGDILLPISHCSEENSRIPHSSVTVLLCSFDGHTLSYKERGNTLSIATPRGLGEPAIAYCGNRYFLTMRHDSGGFVSVSENGIDFSQQQPWTFDDGEELGSYNTQQHWICNGDKLYLVYTRRGLDNDHVFRHRAPLVIAEVDCDNLCVIRDTETIAIPERGARLGNFGVVDAAEHEKWIVASEWMQDLNGNPDNCVKHGANNAVYICRLNFSR